MIISTFSTIGFPVESENALADLAEYTNEVGEKIPVRGGEYVVASFQSGVELWAQRDGDGTLVGLNPHFSGTSTQQLKLEKTITPKDGTKFDGGFYGWINPSTLKVDEGDYPLIFAAPDYLTVNELSLPSTQTVQITAFAEEVTVFDTEEQFLNSQNSGDEEEEHVAFSSRTFIPTGLFTEEDQPNPTPIALMFGFVTKSEERLNEVTGEMFVWLLLDTHGATYDVVIDPRLLDKLPPVGSILGGVFWLSGRIVNDSNR